MPMDNSNNLYRFVRAQEGVYATALAELRGGQKRSHWMWFIFPQLAGLGHSSTSHFFAITNLEEARAYLAHPVLGPRLVECAEAVLAHDGRTATDIFGHTDAMKLRSCMTLFAQVNGVPPVFTRVLEKYFNSEYDGKTLQLLERQPS